MRKILKKIGASLRWIYKRKRNFGIGITITSIGLQAFAPGLMTPAQFKFIELIGGSIAGWGWLHNVVNNSNKINSVVKKAQKFTKIK